MNILRKSKPALSDQHGREMQEKAEIELSMLESIPEDENKKQYRARLLSTKDQCQQRLKDMCEELRLVQTLKEQLEQELDILRTK